jgi:hypothetical protein
MLPEQHHKHHTTEARSEFRLEYLRPGCGVSAGHRRLTDYVFLSLRVLRHSVTAIPHKKDGKDWCLYEVYRGDIV